MIIDGRKISSNILQDLKVKVEELLFRPIFCDVLVGNNKVSRQYVDLKAKKAESIGIEFLHAEFPLEISTNDLIVEIKKLNRIKNLCGLIVQLPLPPHIEKQAVLDAISPEIDVDCMGEYKKNVFYSGDFQISPPPVAAIMYILSNLGMDLENKNILVIGQGELVGRPLTHILKSKGYKVTIADSLTENKENLMKQADVVISAVGKVNLVQAENIKPGSVVIDAGTSEDQGGIVGDVDMVSVGKIASVISPVPGGVGPITVAMLLSNVVSVANLKN